MKVEYRDPRGGEVLAYLSTHARWLKRYDRGEVRFRPSPCCGSDNPQNPSCQVNEVSGLWRCFSASCNKTGNWFTLTREFGDPLPENDRFRNAEFRYSPDWVLRFDKQKRRPVTGGHYPELLTYCLDRNIDRDTLDLWRVSTKGCNNLRWPIYVWHNDKWEMVNARIRACLGEGKTRDWFDISGGPTDLLIGNHLFKLDGPKRAIIFEGQWDAMSATQLGMENVFSLPNGAGNIRVAEMLRYIPEDWEIWLAMDADPAGDRACEQFFHQLGPERIARLQLPAKDLNQWLQDNPDLTSKDVEDTLVGLNYQTMKSKKNSWLTIDPTAEDDEEDNLVTDTPFPVLNDLLAGGFKARQTTGILAPSGRGKTTLVNQLGIYAASQGCTVGLISVEGDRPTLNKKLKETIRGTVPQKDWGKVPRKLLVSDLDGSRVTWRDCLAEFRAMVDTGARLLILDNLDHITGQNNAEKTFAYAEIIEFCKETATHCLVVWQPNKVDRNQIVNSGNQKGHSQMLQDADNYLNLNRVKDFNVIEAEKVREEGIEGDGKVWLVYNKGRRAFDPTTEAPATNLGNSLSVIPLKAYSPVS